MRKNIKVDFWFTYGGHTVSQNGAVKIKLKTKYSELANTIQSLQMLSNDIGFLIVDGKKQNKIGEGFRLYEVKVAHDGTSVITLDGIAEYLDLEKVNELIGITEIEAHGLLKAEIELEDGEEEQEENDSDDDDWGDEEQDEEDWD